METRAVIAERTCARTLHGMLLAAAMALAGCAAGPDYRPPAAQAPDDWTTWRSGDAALRQAQALAGRAGASPIEDAAVFHDPVLADLQARVLAANTDVRTAALRFAQSRMQRHMSAAQRGPEVGVRGGVSRQRQSEYGSATRLIDAVAPPGSRDELVSVLAEPFTVYEAGFDASWELDLWGRVRRTVEAADANVQAAAATLAQTRLAMLAELARAYFELRGAQAQLALLREDIEAAGDGLDVVLAQAQGGLATDFDVARQRTLLAELRAAQPPLLDQEAQLSSRIALLAGERPGGLRDELAPRPTAQMAAKDADLPTLDLGLPSELALRRPDIQAALARLHAATADIGVAIADLYPRIVLGASFGLESTARSHVDDWGSRQWRIGPSLDLPLFDQGRRRATVQLRQLQQQEAAVAYQRAVLDAWHEIDTALAAYAAERGRHAELVHKLQASEQADALAQSSYAGGLTDFLPVLEARRAVIQARRDQVRSVADLAVRLAGLRKALGGTGDWATDVNAEAAGAAAAPQAEEAR